MSIDKNIVIDRLIKRHNIDDVADTEAVRAHIADLASDVTASYVDATDVSRRLALHKIWKDKADLLKTIPQPAQRSPEWFAMRNEMITASDIAQCLGEGKFGTQRDFFEKKVNPDAVTFDASLPPLVWGVKYEQVANMLYCKRNKTDIVDYGLLRHPRIDHIGASPDGISTEGVMVEIKCPWKRVIDGTIPKQYYYQIQFQLDVCDLDECDYLEVKLYEYNGEKAFLNDKRADADEMMAANGNEKGVMIEYMIGVERKYMYNDVVACKSVKGAFEWRDAQLDMLRNSNASNVHVTYWRVDVLSIIRVYKDLEFLRSTYPEIARVWDRVEAYKADNAAFYKEITMGKKTREKKKATAATVSAAVSAAVDVCLCDDD